MLGWGFVLGVVFRGTPPLCGSGNISSPHAVRQRGFCGRPACTQVAPPRLLHVGWLPITLPTFLFLRGLASEALGSEEMHLGVQVIGICIR